MVAVSRPIMLEKGKTTSDRNAGRVGTTFFIVGEGIPKAPASHLLVVVRTR